MGPAGRMEHHSIPTPLREPEPVQAGSSGQTTVADGDIDMNSGDATHINGHHVPATTGDADGMQALGLHSRKLIATIQKLSLLGIDATLPSLPKFVVVGDQSAGKSSIIEAVCDITVPRDHGTCTRCPFQITTSASNSAKAEWMCTVSLLYTHQYSTQPRRGRALDGFDDWIAQETIAVEFHTVFDKTLLEDLLRRAQLAILNPSRNPMDYLRGTPSTATQLNFSPNVVSLDIKGPGLPELSFFDLPGAINIHAEGSHLVKFIERLIKNYVEDPKTLVLLACAANQDIELSTAFRFVDECKALSRCIGVITKPDLVVGVKHYDSLRTILSGEKYQLSGRDAWFVAKQLTQEELDAGILRRRARSLEDSFFLQEPWSTTLSPFAERLGTPKLQMAISSRLTAHIMTELPDITTRVQARLDKIVKDLKLFPNAPTSPSHTVMNVCQKLVDTVRMHIRGDGQGVFRAGYRELIRDMSEEFVVRRPEVRLNTPGYVAVVPLDSDEEEEDTPSKKRRVGSSSQAIPIRTPQRSSRALQTPRFSRTKAEVDVSADGVAMLDLTRLNDMYHRNSDLPGQVDLGITNAIIKSTQHDWPAAVNNSLAAIRVHVEAMLTQVRDKILATRRRTLLYVETAHAIDVFFAAHWARESEFIQ
ncbi:hypothetical protein LTR53_014181 [Teratosphaeriaceae sp. CCFEE 6253]|nr:hypothetical protein LTR53_014181 [Teratosphaeriaceae sp. CCFEE 6253]